MDKMFLDTIAVFEERENPALTKKIVGEKAGRKRRNGRGF
jgi:hypothetical protein